MSGMFKNSVDEKKIECPTNGKKGFTEKSSTLDLNEKQLRINDKVVENDDVHEVEMELDSEEFEELTSCAEDDTDALMEMDSNEALDQATVENVNDRAKAAETQTQVRHHARSRMPRLCWTPNLHRCFLDAVENLGGHERATPRFILERMDVRGLNLDHVKSHLQMYRNKMLDENGRVVAPRNRQRPRDDQPANMPHQRLGPQPQLRIGDGAPVAPRNFQENDLHLKRPINNQLFNFGVGNARPREWVINRYAAPRLSSHLQCIQEPTKVLINDMSLRSHIMLHRPSTHLFDLRDAFLGKKAIIQHQLLTERSPLCTTIENQSNTKINIDATSKWFGGGSLQQSQPYEPLNLINSVNVIKPSNSKNDNIQVHPNINDIGLMNNSLELRLEPHFHLELGRKFADKYMHVEGETSTVTVKNIVLTSKEKKSNPSMDLSLSLNPGDGDIQMGHESANEITEKPSYFLPLIPFKPLIYPSEMDKDTTKTEIQFLEIKTDNDAPESKMC